MHRGLRRAGEPQGKGWAWAGLLLAPQLQEGGPWPGRAESAGFYLVVISRWYLIAFPASDDVGPGHPGGPLQLWPQLWPVAVGPMRQEPCRVASSGDSRDTHQDPIHIRKHLKPSVALSLSEETEKSDLLASF